MVWYGTLFSACYTYYEGEQKNSRVIAGNQLIMLLRFMAKQQFCTNTSTKISSCVDEGTSDSHVCGHGERGTPSAQAELPTVWAN